MEHIHCCKVDSINPKEHCSNGILAALLYASFSALQLIKALLLVGLKCKAATARTVHTHTLGVVRTEQLVKFYSSSNTWQGLKDSVVYMPPQKLHISLKHYKSRCTFLCWLFCL